MHVRGMGEGLGVLWAALKVGQKAKGLKSPVSDNPLSWRTVMGEGSLKLFTRFNRIVSLMQM